MYKAMIATLDEILVQKISIKGWLYLEKKEFDLRAEGIVIDEDRDADPNYPFPPNIIKKLNLTTALDSASIADLIANAEAQMPDITPHQILQAFKFYLDNDAFIDFADQ